jgi:hypothetical protein
MASCARCCDGVLRCVRRASIALVEERRLFVRAIALARAGARGRLDLARVRRAKVALIEGAAALGTHVRTSIAARWTESGSPSWRRPARQWVGLDRAGPQV